MKNPKIKLSIILGLLIVMIGIAPFGCDKIEPVKKGDAKKTSMLAGDCDCTPPTAGQCPSKRNCAKKLLGGSFSQTGVVITWDCCPGFTSQMDICYNSNCRFKLKFYNLPNCFLKNNCLEEDQCIELKNFSCSSGVAIAQDYWTNSNGDSVYIQINGDPHITITCPNGTGCTGVW